MTENLRDHSRTFRVLARTALVVLAAALVIAGIALVPVSATFAERWPEYAGLRMPLLTLALAYLVTVLAALPSVGALVGARVRGRQATEASNRPVTALLVIAAVQVLLLAAVLVLIPGPPALGITLVALTIVTLVALLRGVTARVRLRAHAVHP